MLSSQSCPLFLGSVRLFSRLSLVQRTLVVVVLSLVVLLGGAMWLQIRFVTESRTEELNARLGLVVQIQAAALAAPVWNMETATIDAMLKGLQADVDFAFVTVADQAGSLQQSLGTKNDDVMTGSAPILYDGQTIGALQLSYSTARLKAEIAHLTQLYFAFCVFLILATMAALYGALQMILCPLSRLRATMLALAEGNVEIIVPALDRQDEIGAMAKAVDIFKQNKIRSEMLTNERIQKAAQEREHAIETAGAVESFIRDVTVSLSSFQSAIQQLGAHSNEMTDNADMTRRQAQSVDAATQDSAAHIQAMSHAVTHLGQEVGEITGKMAESQAINREAVAQAEESAQLIEGSAKAATDIVGVIALIENIAAQTNLLALNATIEAARAGEAGRGFAVVAQEVRSLAGQTGQATKTIQQQVGAIKTAMDNAVAAIGAIVKTIAKASSVSDEVHKAVQAQSADVGDITALVRDIVASGDGVRTSMGKVSVAADVTFRSADEIGLAAHSLDDESHRLKALIDTFVAKVAVQNVESAASIL